MTMTAPTNIVPIDWQRLCLNLRRHKSLTAIAEQIGADAATLRRLARAETQEPKFSTALKLLDLHYELNPQGHCQLWKC